MTTFVFNHRKKGRPAQPSRSAYDWHRTLDGYLPTPLLDMPEIAARVGLERLWVKDETRRLGMPAFKILGVSWAAKLALDGTSGRPVLAAGTDGNHGHAVARVAAEQGCRARIFMPEDTSAERIARIHREGAEVEVVNGDFDLAVGMAAHFAATADGAVLISDTAIEPGEEIPRAVIDGYGTLFWEVGEQLPAMPDLVVIQIGSGGLAAAAGRFFRRSGSHAPSLWGIEPKTAACALASVGQLDPAQIISSFGSVMVGLNAGRLSAAAWPDVSAAYDGFAAIDDEWCFEALSLLSKAGITAGETGASGLAGLLALRDSRENLVDIRKARTALIVVTEGALE